MKYMKRAIVTNAKQEKRQRRGCLVLI